MEPILRVESLVKRFGGLTAVNRVSMDVFPGEVVGLVGDNGAGKSTLIKMISGVYRPDEGRVIFEGKERDISSPADARELGIETIYQDLALAENLDVGSNIFLGREPVQPAFAGLVQVLDRRHMLGESQKVLNRLDIHIPNLRVEIRNLSGGQRQAVAIARAIYWDVRVMIMDEPTAALGVTEQRKVLNLVRTLRGQGVSVIVISHNMSDVFAVADRLVVLRRGIKAGERMAGQTNVDEIVSLMVGSETVEGGLVAETG